MCVPVCARVWDGPCSTTVRRCAAESVPSGASVCGDHREHGLLLRGRPAGHAEAGAERGAGLYPPPTSLTWDTIEDITLHYADAFVPKEIQSI